MARWLLAGLLFACLLPTGLDAVAVAAPPARAGGETTLAILYFDYSGRDASLEALRKGLAQMLISDLAAVDNLRVVERERLQAILEEQKLARSGKIDAATAASVGKLLGARYLVMGSYFDALGAFRVDARLVDVETGEVVKSVGANGKADDFLALEQSIADGLRQAASKLPVAPPGRGAAGSSSSPAAGAERRLTLKLPKRLKTETALDYGRALVAIDDGDRKTAQTLFRKVLSAQPDFGLAQRDLGRLMQ